jgi:uncharacterized SAM-binding protein YcdF (DUF218 family)
MDLAIKQIISTLLLLPASALLLAGAGGWLLWWAASARSTGPAPARYRRLGAALLGLCLAVLWLASTEAVHRTALRMVEAPWKAYAPWVPKPGAPAQAVVVLGGGRELAAHEYGGPSVSLGSLARLRYGIHIARAHQLPVLFTGGSSDPGVGELPELSEAALAAQVAEREFRYPLRWVESRSRDTQENASLSAAMLRPGEPGGVRTIALVTDVWHMPRAVRWFERVGFVVQPAPMGFKADRPLTYRDWLPSADVLGSTNRLLREALGQAWQALRG